ncbi:alpha-L-fucosidase [Labilibacter marinus]|uniref:alpha-L-fucosidase n=1 Tax=Labilibacter marinus TaxID=1477105 RepID=UPI0009500221|nr:alpha-L-fucosidase [Labilibacter marinus]
MKYNTLLSTISLSLLIATNIWAQTPTNKKFEANMESLRQYECPEWFRDAKFGIWAHWGPQSVPMHGDWYARVMYEQHTRNKNRKTTYAHHVKTYGHPSEFGYKDLIPLWKAEKFNPEELMKLYKKAGAKYFVSMGVHHDNFDLWDSKFNRWNAVDMGPKRDIVGAWSKAAKKHGLKFGVSEHLSAGYGWWQANKGADIDGPKAGVPYDGADPKLWDLYYSKSTAKHESWVTNNGMFAQLWFARMTDLLENYEPDLLYSDGALPFGTYGEEMLANFYNADIEKNKGQLEAVYLAKPARHNKGWNVFDGETCVEDRERGGLADISPEPWQTDTSIGDWFYNVNWKNDDTGTMYRSPFWVLSTLIDVVSKNGNMLLNVLQRPDGTVDKEVVELLETLAAWMDANGESIFGSRPWTVYGEGPQEREGAADWKEDFDYTPKDIRYTQNKENTFLYAATMGMPTEDIVLKEVTKEAGKVSSVTLLGSNQKIKWKQSSKALVIKLPNLSACTVIPVFKIEWK